MRSRIWLLAALLVAACAGSIAQREPERNLTVAEIKRDLRGTDFRKKNRARAQIDKVPVADRVALLVELDRDPDAATRTLAVAELGKLADRPEVAAELKRVSTEDEDEDVRDLAAAFVEEPESEPASTPASEPASAPTLPQ